MNHIYSGVGHETKKYILSDTAWYREKICVIFRLVIALEIGRNIKYVYTNLLNNI